MCKHVAAVLYGVGARLDREPALLFLLRGVDEEELISAGTEAAATAVEGGEPGRIAEEDLSELFGIDMAEEAPPTEPPKDPEPAGTGPETPAREKTLGERLAAARRRARGRPKPQAASRRPPKEAPSPDPAVTGKEVARLRKRFAMTQGQLARLLGVSNPCVGNWERKKGPLNLHTRTRQAWEQTRSLTKKQAWARLEKKR
jgi:DNA-binding XRE family transcriptional regulator